MVCAEPARKGSASGSGDGINWFHLTCSLMDAVTEIGWQRRRAIQPMGFDDGPSCLMDWALIREKMVLGRTLGEDYGLFQRTA